MTRNEMCANSADSDISLNAHVEETIESVIDDLHDAAAAISNLSGVIENKLYGEKGTSGQPDAKSPNGVNEKLKDLRSILFKAKNQLEQVNGGI